MTTEEMTVEESYTSAEANVDLQRIAVARGNEKKEILKEAMKHPLMVKVLQYALDPALTYGVTRIQVGGKSDGDVMSDSSWELLDSLANRSLRGGDATAAINAHIRTLDYESAALLRAIILKDLRAGIRVSTVNKIAPGTIPVFECMLAAKYDEKRIKKWPVMLEPKLDGVRVLAVVDVDKSAVKFVSRTGKPMPAFDHLKEAVLKLVTAARVDAITDENEELADYLIHCVIDGEMVSGSFNETVSSARRKEEQATDAIHNVFAILPYDQFIEGKTTIHMRGVRAVVDAVFAGAHVDILDRIRPVNSYWVNSAKEIATYYESIRARGLEGVIVKDPDKTYVCKRNPTWMKIKGEESEDLRVVGVFEGTGKYTGMLGGLVVDRDGIEVRVGGGFSDEQRSEFWSEWERDCDRIAEAKSDQLGLVGRLIEVQYHEVTPDGSLRHPRFVRFRDDKDYEAAW